ncbi:MAG TPA: DedA family protein [Kofleriaceae bacterium]|nr:DedA family protein [Kofleriaceae bacterium]
MLDSIAHTIQDFIREVGYPGLFLMIVLESTMVPIPSLLVMPFAGALAAKGVYSLPVILAINGTGAITGSLLSYWLGAAGGKPLLEKYGKYVLVKPADLKKTEEFFARHGAWTVFIARFVPVARHLISIPAGVARMRLPVFVLQTFMGAMIWGGGLMVFGYVLADKWESIAKSAKKVDMVIAVLIVLTTAFVVFRWIRKRRAAQRAGSATSATESPSAAE